MLHVLYVYTILRDKSHHVNDSDQNTASSARRLTAQMLVYIEDTALVMLQCTNELMRNGTPLAARSTQDAAASKPIRKSRSRAASSAPERKPMHHSRVEAPPNALAAQGLGRGPPPRLLPPPSGTPLSARHQPRRHKAAASPAPLQPPATRSRMPQMLGTDESRTPSSARSRAGASAPQRCDVETHAVNIDASVVEARKQFCMMGVFDGVGASDVVAASVATH